MAQKTISAVVVVAIAAAALVVVPLSVAGDPSPAPAPIGMPNCVTSCGGVDVPYPFGIGPDASCYLPGFNLTCDNTTGRLLLDADGTLRIVSLEGVGYGSTFEAERSGDIKVGLDGGGTYSSVVRRGGPYTLNLMNELILTGCNVQATLNKGNVTVSSCTSLCRPAPDADDGSISDDAECFGGTGCCRADIVVANTLDHDHDDDDGEGYTVQLRWLGSNRSADLERFPVRVFVAKQGWFKNGSISHDLMQTSRPPSHDSMAVPVYLTWNLFAPQRVSRDRACHMICKSKHSDCLEGTRGAYLCTCKDGYDGNPYLTHGCKDKNECDYLPQSMTQCYGECINTEGSFTCRCPPGTSGNHAVFGGCVDASNIADTGNCKTSCGGVEVPYPFGLGPYSSCYLPGFKLTCDTRYHTPRLLFGNVVHGYYARIVKISIVNSTVRVVVSGALIVADDDWSPGRLTTRIMDFDPFPFSGESPYSLSTGNELVLTGCNAQAMLLGHGNPSIISGCASFCSHNGTTSNSTRHGGNGDAKYCYGMGCCQARISESMDGMPNSLEYKWFDSSDPHDLIPLPRYVFIAEEGWFDQPGVTGKLMREGRGEEEDWKLAKDMEVPILLRWEILHLHNGSTARPPNVSSSHPDCGGEIARDLCKSRFSQCKPGNRGYLCRCNDGYHGNPYVHDGCKGGRAKFFKGISIIVGVASVAGLILLVLLAYFISYKLKHRRAQMLKRKYFELNQLLQQLVSQRADIAEKMIITLEELEKATNNFDKAHELGGGGHGTVYKGILSYLHVVAIKKPKMVFQREIDEFINEVAILSQINHRNVVKLYGCCLETEVPLLVYEFISNGTLCDHLHVEGPRSLSWDDRLRIAIETAKSLVYLHSTASVPIIHRDVKPANILLDDNLTAKVADFGASRYIPLEKSGLTTNVQGTLGYLDPMYMHIRRLTEKSDVYSFGVMLIELMTRKKPIPYVSSGGNGLVAHFSTLFADGNLSQILDPQVMSEGDDKTEEIAGIAVACVNLREEELPTMRQVELRLEATQTPEEFEENGDVAEISPLEYREELTSRQYSMEEEYIVSARYPR